MMMMTMMMMSMMMMIIDDDVLKHVHLSHTPTRFFLKLIQLSKMRQGVFSKQNNARIWLNKPLWRKRCYDMQCTQSYPINLKECVGNFQRFQQLRSFRIFTAPLPESLHWFSFSLVSSQLFCIVFDLIFFYSEHFLRKVTLIFAPSSLSDDFFCVKYMWVH